MKKILLLALLKVLLISCNDKNEDIISNPEGKIKIIFKGNTKWHDESIRDILLSEIPGNPETPKNSYNTTSLNKKIAPPVDKSAEKNLKQF